MNALVVSARGGVGSLGGCSRLGATSSSGAAAPTLRPSAFTHNALGGQPRRACLRVSRARTVECSASAMALPLPEDDSRGGQGKTSGFMDMVAAVRGIMFYLWTFTIAMPFFVVMLAIAPFVLTLDKVKRRAQHFVNNIWAKMSTFPFYPVKVEGRENLPKSNEAVVYVANHESFLDIYSLFHLNRGFKFISKTSNFMIPIIGWSMFLTGHVTINRVDVNWTRMQELISSGDLIGLLKKGHVMINRVDRRSQMKCLNECKDLLADGASVLFFPEGTRTADGRMDSFKKGAFSVAVKAGVKVVPITLCGTGALMPNGKESKLFPGRVRVVVHKPIDVGKDAQAACDEAQRVIAGALPSWKTDLLKKV